MNAETNNFYFRNKISSNMIFLIDFYWLIFNLILCSKLAFYTKTCKYNFQIIVNWKNVSEAIILRKT